jgi:tetratricopeptide (TPR) repeat protein
VSNVENWLADAQRVQAAGQSAEAEALRERVVEVEPRHNVALYFLALSAERAGKLDRAIELFARCVTSDVPDAATSLHHSAYATALSRAGKHEDAIAAANRALAIDPNCVDAFYIKGIALEKLGREPEAIAVLRLALAAKPDHVDSLSALANVLVKRAEPAQREEAVKLLFEARRLKPNSADLAGHLGNALRLVGKPAQAVGSFRDAVNLRPDIPEVHNNLGVALQESGQITDAIISFRKALALRGDFAEAQWNLALMLLMSGQFDEGWMRYEWRRKLKADENKHAPPPHPEWAGGPLKGMTLLLRAEQGLGDTIQFIRYAPLLKDRGARIIVECQPPLVALLRGAQGVDQVIARGEPLPPIDLHVRMMSLPGILGGEPRDIPANVPYLHPDPERLAYWKEQLAGFAGLKVGIAWQGSAGYAGDASRSIPLAFFEPLARVDGVRLFSIQKGFGVEQLDPARQSFLVHDFLPLLDDHSAGSFVDTAAVIKNLDLVITSDTSVAHLAGALGIKVWVALCRVPDWRWMLGRTDSPWYPTMRLFRQTRAGDWKEVFERIADALRKECGAPAPVRRVMVPLSPGELVDRITILQIKGERITDGEKLARVRLELEALRKVASQNLPPVARLDMLTAELTEINETLWEVEDALRDREREQCFDEEFIALERAVYHTNDRRAAIKKEINLFLGSEFIDEKSYASYPGEGGGLTCAGAVDKLASAN